jgi:anti-sigma factor RsiW
MTILASLPCAEVREMFSPYLDGAITGLEMQAIASHLDACLRCQHEFNLWRGMQQTLGQIARVEVPNDLGLKLRLAASHESSRRQSHWYEDQLLRWENLVRPMLFKFSAGLASSIVLIGSIGMLLGAVAAPEAVLAHDEPLGAVTAPHYLYSAADLPSVVTPENTTIVIQADINAEGRVYNYSILSGPLDPAILAQVRDQLMVQVYAPARVFEQPVRGRVLITFAGVSVRG